MLQVQHVATPVPYLWQCTAIEGTPEKGHCRVKFECPMGKVVFWCADPTFLESLAVGSYYTFGVTPAYHAAGTAAG